MRFLAAIAVLSFCAATAHAAIPSRVQPQIKTENIRVSLGLLAGFRLRAQDLSLDHKPLLSGVAELSVACDGDNETPIRISGIGSVGSPANLDSPAGFLWFNEKSYREHLTVYAQNGLCLVVNTLSMDAYLAGLLNKEMSPTWPLEALKAQAVAARSYALFQMEQGKNPYYDVEATTMDQVYEGSESETPRSYLAVQSTKGMVLTWKEKPIKAFYHANCGGRTEVPSDVWGADLAYFKPVVCPFHKTTETKTAWTYSLTKEKLQQSLRRIANLLPHNFLRVASVQAGPLNANQRLQTIRLTDTEGRRAEVPANAFRNALGNTKVKSTAFNVQNNGSEISIRGEGFGHGVGLCQIGAREMARQGKSFSDILHFYYPLAKLSRIQ